VPFISTFFGIVIRMYYKEHEPVQFHAEHAGQHAKFTFDGELVAGEMRSRRARERIREWSGQDIGARSRRAPDGDGLVSRLTSACSRRPLVGTCPAAA
jgi:cytochrome P450